MIDIKTLNIEEKILLMEELLNEFNKINSPSWHKKVLDTRKDYKNKKLYSVEEIKKYLQKRK